MAEFDFVSIAWFMTILSAVYGSVDDMHRDEIETSSFDVKPGAGRQEYVRQWVCSWLRGGYANRLVQRVLWPPSLLPDSPACDVGLQGRRVDGRHRTLDSPATAREASVGRW